MTLPENITIRPVAFPAEATGPGSEDYVAAMTARNAVYAEIAGNHDEDMTPEELLPLMRQSTNRKRWWVIEVDGAVVGRVIHDTALEADSRSTNVETLLLRSCWGRGIGSAAHEILLDATRAEGRDFMQTWAEHPADATVEQVEAPTGFGSIPLDHTARFLLRHGYVLEQIERRSVLDLTAVPDTVPPLLEAAQRAAIGYRVLQWTGDTPQEYVDGLARMKNRMSTDAPAAGMDVEEEHWDEARIAEQDENLSDSGLFRLVTAAQHAETGELCAYTELSIRRDHTAASDQGDTLVLREHRGHRLGMLIKCAGLLRWRDLMPLSPRVLTWNAEENRPMLDVNEAIGFTPAAYIGAWQLTL